MSGKRGFFFVLLALAAFLFVAVPQGAYAATDPCPDGNAVDAAYQKAMAATGQAIVNDVTKAWATLQRIDVAAMYCTQKLMTTFQTFVSSISGLTDPLGVVIGILGPQLVSMVNQVCSQVMSAVNSIKNSISALTRICIPLPSFGIGGFNFNLNVQQCSGGTSIQLIQGGSPFRSPSYGSTWLSTK